LNGGSGNDSLYGGSDNDSLNGGSGADYLDGGIGADSMAGGSGNDSYFVDDAGDAVTESDGQGASDWVNSTINFTLGANLEGLSLQGTADINGTGNELDNSLYGNDGANILNGGVGDDYLNGGAGADTMTGGAGNDSYEVDNAGDTVTEAAGAGTDTVRSFVGYTLGANLENLELYGTGNINGTGNSLDNSISGNSGNNILSGGSGNDGLYGGEGADTLNGGTGNDNLNGGGGADIMSGGAGNDYYTVDNAADTATEAAGAGTDTVYGSVSYTLGANLENLYLQGTADINATGNGLDNYLYGNDGANILTGGAGDDVISGGTGTDAMSGGVGDDQYYVDNTGDTVTEAAGEGTDQVYSYASFTLGVNLENLSLYGSDNINGTGNSLSNMISGNSGNNVLNGGGGNDSLSGYYGNDSLIGGAGNDLMYGGDGNDTLTGGSGTDTLYGGAGSDTFVYTSNNEGVDTINDFSLGAANDLLDLTALGITADAGHLQFTYDGYSTHVSVDVDGGANSFVEISVLQGVNMTLADTDNYAV
ncbi:MAG: calcium-binding protein, partial [Thermodesulfovibrionales bacterium]